MRHASHSDCTLLRSSRLGCMVLPLNPRASLGASHPRSQYLNRSYLIDVSDTACSGAALTQHRSHYCTISTVLWGSAFYWLGTWSRPFTVIDMYRCGTVAMRTVFAMCCYGYITLYWAGVATYWHGTVVTERCYGNSTVVAVVDWGSCLKAVVRTAAFAAVLRRSVTYKKNNF